MRYEKGHKDLTRQRIVEVASRQFREHGVAAVGIAGIMTDAGLTNGAFYAHFDSKEDLVREVLSHAGFRNKLSKAAENGTGLAGAIRDYLSQNHRDNPGQGCPTSALVAEIARHPKATRDAFTGKVDDVIA
ncbi:MAG: TetR/AcrR family transcriptional regulator, partial [Xanthobacteraceae bacterium]